MDYPADNSYTLLIVDDNKAHIRLIREAFRESSSSPQIESVNDGIEALNYLYRQEGFVDAPRPSLILLDLNLPRKNGREVLADIKTDPTLKNIPVIVLSTSRSEDDIRSCYSLHANCYIRKPSNLKQLLTVVKRIGEYWFQTAYLPAFLDPLDGLST